MLNNIFILQQQLKFIIQITEPAILPSLINTTQIGDLYVIHDNLWAQLSFPHPTTIRLQTYDLLLDIETILVLFKLDEDHYNTQHKFSRPSITTQIVTSPNNIINPYYNALKKTTTSPYPSNQ